MSDFQDKVQLLNNLSYKFAQTFTYNSNKVSDTFHFGERLNLNRDFIYTLKLNGFYGWENIINITDRNNQLHYSVASNAPWKLITIPVGIWNFSDINKIKSILTHNSDSEDNITISVNKNEYRTILTLTGGYRVNFDIPNSIYEVLGFKKTIYRGTHKSPNIPDIANAQLYFIVINLIEPNILWKKDGEAKSLQYVRAIKPYQKNVGEAVIIQDNNPIKYKLLESAYDREYCRISLVDEDGNLIHTKGDEFIVVFTIEST